MTAFNWKWIIAAIIATLVLYKLPNGGPCPLGNHVDGYCIAKP